MDEQRIDELEGDLDLEAADAEGVKGGAPVGVKQASTIYQKTVKNGNIDFEGGRRTVDRTASTQPLGGLNGDNA